MRIAVTGASGLVGRALTGALVARGDEAVGATRAPSGALRWSTDTGFQPPDALAGYDAVVHLAGAGVAERRWTAAHKREVERSRTDGTRAVVEAIDAAGRDDASRRPKILVCASAQGYYGTHDDRVFVEGDGPGSDWLAQVCVAWEAEAARAQALGVRLVLLRTGIVLAREGGALGLMRRPFAFFVGGRTGSGRQWMSWIHLDDVVGMILWAIDNPAVSGPVNVVAPNPVTNADFSRALGRALRRPCWLPVPAFALRLLLGEMAQIVLEGTRVDPSVARRLGYAFRHPELDGALADLCK